MIRHRWTSVVVGFAVVLTACGDGSTVVVRPPTGTPPGPTSSASSTSPTARPVHPKVTIRPHGGLRDGQRVKVTATGFSPDEPLTVIQCADKGQATGPGDCNLPSMLAASSDANGRLVTTLAVSRGPFGANAVVCTAKQPCLISVTQASLNPTEQANSAISFATR